PAALRPRVLERRPAPRARVGGAAAVSGGLPERHRPELGGAREHRGRARPVRARRARVALGSSRAVDWLLLRGLAREQRHWRGFREQLERASGARVCCVDVAGAGTERARVPWPSLRWLARDVARRLPGWAGADRAGQRWNVLGL